MPTDNGAYTSEVQAMTSRAGQLSTQGVCPPAYPNTSTLIANAQTTSHRRFSNKASNEWSGRTYPVADSHIQDPAVPPALVEVGQHVLEGQLHQFKADGQHPQHSIVPNNERLQHIHRRKGPINSANAY